MVVGALVEVDLVGPDDRREDLRVAGGQGLGVLQLRHRVAGGDRSLPRETKIQPSVPSKRMPLGKSSLMIMRHAVGVEGLGLEWAVHVPEALLGELGRAPDLDGPVYSVPMPQWAMSTWWAPQPVIMPAPNCSQRSQPGRSYAFLRVDALLGVVDVRASSPATCRSSGSAGPASPARRRPRDRRAGRSRPSAACRCGRCGRARRRSGTGARIAAGCRSGRCVRCGGRRR